MEPLFYAFGVIFAALLVAAAAVYPLDPRKASGILKRGSVAMLALLLVPALASQVLKELDLLPMLLFLPLACFFAYLVREQRLKKDKSRSNSSRGAERTPILPRRKE